MTDQLPMTLDDLKVEIEAAAKDTVVAKIKLGGLLQAARDMFPADQEFGAWRKENIPWVGQSSAHEHMNVHKKFGSHTHGDRLPGFEVLKMLARDTTPAKTVAKVLKRKKITVKQVKEMISKDRGVAAPLDEHDYFNRADDAIKRAMTALNKCTPEHFQELMNEFVGTQYDLDVSIEDRIQYHDPWAVLGLAPGSSHEAVKTMARTLAAKHHPDKGGSVKIQTAINKARDEILK